MHAQVPQPRRIPYLSGMDWFVHALDCRTRRATGTGNDSQVALALAGVVEPERLRARLEAFVARNPALAGRCRRHWNLAPYWSFGRAARPRDLRLAVRHLDDNLSTESVLAALGEAVSRPLRGPLRIAFTLARHRDRTYVAMQFDHRLLDAGGAEALLLHLSQGDPTPAPLALAPAHLNRWREKFMSGQTVNRELIALRGERPPAALPLPARVRGQPRPTRFVFRLYTPAETAAIHAQAERRAGYLRLLPFLLGATIGALHKLCMRQGVAGGDYAVPVTVDSRQRNGARPSLFFNQVSFNFYRFPAALADDATALCAEASRQMYAQVQKSVAQHVAQAGMLMRILPAPWLGRLMTWPLWGGLGSLSFSFLGQSGYRSETFLKAPVENVLHTPRVPAPPGIGVFFTQYRDRMTLVCSYLDGMLDPAAAARFVREIDAELKGAH